MAAELSTGVLAMANVYGRKPAVSMLLIGIKGKFYKKAIGKTFFTCTEGDRIREAVAAAIDTKTGQEVTVFSTGKNESGDVVSEFWVTWSFKSK
jgi:hypothetical protein